MNFYRYIVLEIQDMSSGELVHPISKFNHYDNSFIRAKRPLQYYVDANNLMSLLSAKEIVTALLNSVYEVLIISEDLDSQGEYVMKPTAVYIDNLIYYNTIVIPILTNPATMPEAHFKKLTKGRFQIVERFTSEQPDHIKIFDGSIAW
jgi:hypothetical protein